MLGNRTAYSFRRAIGDISASHAKITKINSGLSVISDTASTFSHTKWSKLCKEAGSKPVFGVEIAVTDSMNEKKPGYSYWTFIAKNDLSAIHSLLLAATSQFRYVPLLTYDQANRAGGVIKIAGSSTNLAMTADDVYFALSPSLSIGQFKAIDKSRFVASSDNYYLNEEDRDLYGIQLGRDANMQVYKQHLLTMDEWRKELAYAGNDILNSAAQLSLKLMGETNAAQKMATLISPEHPKSLLEMCKDGAASLGVDLSDPVYAARLEKELGLISSKKFEDYFYIIADVCQWARERMVVGPARGSSCGSLVCYLLGITTVDPIPYGLIFERFIDVNRDDLPDIDIDFNDVKRQMVFEYMASKYGRDHIARLGTVAIYRPKSALHAAAAALGVPRFKVERVADSIIDRSGGDSRALQRTVDTLNDTESGRALISEYPEMMISVKMEGQPTHHSQHAAGIVLTDKPVIEYVGVDSRTGATHCDKKDAEELGLLKIDALGLTQLSVFEDTINAIGKDIDMINSIPLDDQDAFDILNNKKYAGVFQFNGIALQAITNQTGVHSLNDIVSITALARPGPLNSGGTSQWIKVKTGKAPLSVPHEIFRPHLEETLGVVCYQEQVMNIGREIGDLTWGDVTALRKAMSKSLGKEYFDKYGDRWKAGAKKKGVPDEVLTKVWDDLCAYGAWAFNKSHAVAYGLVSYYCCWFKAHHTIEFAAATLSHIDNEDQQVSLLRELAAEGIEYVPVDKELSVANWQTGIIDGKKKLIGPLSNVKGIGPKMMAQILSARARKEPLTGKAAKLLENPTTTIDSLWPIKNRFEELMPDPSQRNIYTPPKRIVDCDANGTNQEVLVFATLKEIKPKDENEDVNVAKRGYKVSGPTQAINLWIADDTDKIFAKVDRFKYSTIGKEIIERGRPGKSLYAIKGYIPSDYRMIRISMIRYIGDMDK